MITKCVFCEHQSKDEPLDENVLSILAEEELPHEDYMLWLERLLKSRSLKSYNGIKIHMGRMHKDLTYKYISPTFVLSEKEIAILNGSS